MGGRFREVSLYTLSTAGDVLDEPGVELAGVVRVEPADLLPHDRAEEMEADLLGLSVSGHQPEGDLSVGAHQHAARHVYKRLSE